MVSRGVQTLAPDASDMYPNNGRDAPAERVNHDAPPAATGARRRLTQMGRCFGLTTPHLGRWTLTGAASTGSNGCPRVT